MNSQTSYSFCLLPDVLLKSKCAFCRYFSVWIHSSVEWITARCQTNPSWRFLFENNRLTGEINLARLPDGMEDLRLTNNQISGTLDFTHLPDGMKPVFLASNQLTGEIDLTHLPDGMGYLYLQNNQLSGPLVIQKIPPKMKMIDLEENHFHDIAVVNSKTCATIKLKESGVTSVVNEDGNERGSRPFFG